MKLNTKSNNGGSATSEVLFNQTYNSSSSSSNNNNNFNNNNNGYNNSSSSSNNNEFQFASNRGVHAIHSNSSTQYQPTIPSPISSSSTTTTTLSQQYHHHHHHHQSTAPSSSSDRSSRVGDATSNSVYERSTIENLCVPGGLRPVPPENELQDFLTVAPTLSADIVGR